MFSESTQAGEKKANVSSARIWPPIHTSSASSHPHFSCAPSHTILTKTSILFQIHRRYIPPYLQTQPFFHVVVLDDHNSVLDSGRFDRGGQLLAFSSGQGVEINLHFLSCITVSCRKNNVGGSPVCSIQRGSRSDVEDDDLQVDKVWFASVVGYIGRFVNWSVGIRSLTA